MKFKCHCLQIKFYWNTAIPVHLCIVCDRFPTATSKLSQSRDHMAYKKMYCVVLYRRYLLTCGLEGRLQWLE